MCRVVACTRELSTVDGAHRTTFAKPRIRSPLRRALSLLTYCAALAVGANDPGHAADAPVYMPVKAPQFAPPPYPEPSWNWGAMLGAVGTASASVNSTAPGGFYKGAFDDVMAPYAGLFADFRIARFGSSSQPFGTWVLSIGPVVDVRHSSLSYNGTGGGVPVSDSGRLTQWDTFGVLRLTTTVTHGSNLRRRRRRNVEADRHADRAGRPGPYGQQYDAGLPRGRRDIPANRRWIIGGAAAGLSTHDFGLLRYDPPR